MSETTQRAQEMEMRLLCAEGNLDSLRKQYEADKEQWRQAVLAEQQARQEAEQARDRFRAALAAAGYERLDELSARPIELARAVGRAARERTLEVIAAREAAEQRAADLRVALQTIADSDDECQCDHTDDNCCARVPSGFCARCVAAASLLARPLSQQEHEGESTAHA
jgi:hypothetical protein